MHSDDSFTFRTSVSLDYYEKKTDATACLSKAGAKAIGKNKMAFREVSVTIPEFLEYATSGYAFCNLFEYDPDQRYWIETPEGKKMKAYPVYKNGPNKGAMKLTTKSDQFFKGAQTVFVDVDYTRFTSVEKYIATLSYQPSCVYMSYSDGLAKGKKKIVSRRFRLVYVLDQIVGRDDLKRISQAINDQIVIDTAEPMEDECGTRPCQYMNGVYGNPETYNSGWIYSVSDFPTQTEASDALMDSDSDGGVVFDEDLVRDMSTMGKEEFMHYYSTRYQYLYRTCRQDWTGLYQLTDDSYLQLWFYTEKQVDGQQRRRKLGKNACLRRLIYPEIDANTLLFNLYVDFIRFIDNSDGVIRPETLMRKVRWAMGKTPEQLQAFCAWEIQYWKEHRPKFIVKPGIVTSRGQLAKICKQVRWAELDAQYDRTKSLQENLVTLDVSKRTLYRYCKERFIDTMPGKQPSKAMRRAAQRKKKQAEIDKFRSIYNASLSLRQNIKAMERMGLHMSTKKLSAWINKYSEQEKVTPQTSFGFPAPPSFLNWQPDLSQYEMPVCDWDVHEAQQNEPQFSKINWGEAPAFCFGW